MTLWTFWAFDGKLPVRFLLLPGSGVLAMLRALLAFTMLPAFAAHADGFSPVTEEKAFLALVEGRDLRMAIFNMTLNILPDGQITGKAMGWPVRGTWEWKDGFFCRQMDWGGMEIEYNCQLVEERRGTRLRFTVDQGEGDSAAFDLR